MIRFNIQCCSSLLLIITAVLPVVAQERLVDFSKDPNAQVRFFSDGMALEIPLNFLMQGESRHRLKAILPEEGRFEVVMIKSGKAKLENVKTQAEAGKPPIGEAEFMLDLKRLSPQQAQLQAEQTLLALLPEELKEARQEREKKKPAEINVYLNRQGIKPPPEEAKAQEMYDKVRAAELGKDTLRAKLKEFAKGRPEWFVKADVEAIDTLSGPDAMRTYGELLSLEVAEPYLREMGLTYETTPRTFRDVIWGNLNGIDALLSGDSSEEKQKAMRSLPQATRDDLRNAITVEASLRFYPTADESDPNSQWYLAQQVECAIRGIRSVRLQGRLDPTAGDKSDWWVLGSFDRSTLDIEWPRGEGVRYETFDEGSRQVKLRVVATGNQPVDYVIEFTAKAAGRSSRSVVIVESPSRADAKFPF